MVWIDEHVEKIVGVVMSALAAVVAFFARLTWNDREQVLGRLGTIETKQAAHTSKIETLEQEVREADVEAAEDRKEILARLETNDAERKTDSVSIHARITDVARGVSRIEGALDWLKNESRK